MEVTATVTKDNVTIIVNKNGIDYDYDLVSGDGLWNDDIEDILGELQGVCSDLAEQI